MKALIQRIRASQFLFSELVKRDFKRKYKRTVLGMLWSVLYPLLNLLVMRLVFTRFFGRGTPFYTTYLFAGNLCFAWFRESTKGGMTALMENAGIFTRIRVQKYLFVLSKNVSAIINFSLTLIVFFLFAAIDGVAFSWWFLALIYPIFCLLLFNIGVGLILSALYVFFRDTQYFYDLFLVLLNYLSAIFYTVERYPEQLQRLFLLNPVYCAIKYFRVVVIDGHLPSPAFHLLMLGYALAALLAGGVIYRRKNQTLLYYF